MKLSMKKLEILKKNIKFRGGLLELKDFLMILELLLLRLFDFDDLLLDSMDVLSHLACVVVTCDFNMIEFSTAKRSKYGVSTSIGYGISNFLSNTVYSFKLINKAYPLPLDTAYPLPLDTVYRSSGTESEILVFLFDFHAKKFLPFFKANPADIFTFVTGKTYQS
ncbi:hypothetical protein Tco_0624781 [Tanacetum coccineum]|uniref:Uncharacterized protein n=1 Tax=Tanacetum coccineum TaxID=301880 RepID=A0ABQ4WF26_9ASTR